MRDLAASRPPHPVALGVFLWALAAHRPLPSQAAVPAAPEPPPVGTAQLTLGDALERARKNNRDLQAARERLRESHVDVARAFSALLPRISAQARYTYNYPEISATYADSATSTTTVTLTPQHQIEGALAATVPLLQPAAYPTLDSARLAYKGQQQQLAVTEAQLLQSVAASFFAAAGAEGLERIRVHALEVSQETVLMSRQRLRQGVTNRLDVTRAELSVLKARQLLREAKDTRSAAYRVLANLVQLPGPFQVVAPPEPAAEPRGADALVAQALHDRPELRVIQTTVQAAETEAKAHRWRWAPTLSAVGSLRLTNATGFTNQQVYAAGGAQLDWQIFDGLERDALRSGAQARAAGARLRLLQLRDTITADVRTAHEQLLSRQDGMEVARQTLRLAQEAAALVRLQHTAGTATQLELLMAQDQVVAAEVGVEQARFDLGLQSATLRHLLGAPLG